MRIILTTHSLPSGRFVIRPIDARTGETVEDVRTVETYEEGGETFAKIDVRIRAQGESIPDVELIESEEVDDDTS